VKSLEKLAELHGVDGIPDAKIPDITTFAVLVKTNKYATLGSIPQELEDRPSIQGLVINQIHSLKEDEKKLIKSGFPSLDVDKVLILEDGRTPAPLGKSVGMMLGGVLLVAGGIGAAVFSRLRAAA
jgi:hypothetical protein